jgi:hypothetical protein
MKTLPGFIFLMGAGACAVCAAQTPATSSAPAASTEAPATSTASDHESVPPRTIPSHPETPPAAAKNLDGAYAGYRRVVVNGQELYCRNDQSTGSHTQRTPVCGTAAQVKAEELAAQRLILDIVRRDASAIPLQGPMGAMSPRR